MSAMFLKSGECASRLDNVPDESAIGEGFGAVGNVTEDVASQCDSADDVVGLTAIGPASFDLGVQVLKELFGGAGELVVVAVILADDLVELGGAGEVFGLDELPVLEESIAIAGDGGEVAVQNVTALLQGKAMGVIALVWGGFGVGEGFEGASGDGEACAGEEGVNGAGEGVGGDGFG